jgi:hypothetical protein
MEIGAGPLDILTPTLALGSDFRFSYTGTSTRIRITILWRFIFTLMMKQVSSSVTSLSISVHGTISQKTAIFTCTMDTNNRIWVLISSYLFICLFVSLLICFIATTLPSTYSYCSQITSWSLRGVDVLSAVRGSTKHAGGRKISYWSAIRGRSDS